jgi:hypothetical protein
MTRALALLAIVLLLALAQLPREALERAAPGPPLAPAAGTGRLLGSVLMGTFRPLLLTYLWIRGDILFGQGRADECYELYRLLHRLYPGNDRAREYLGWFLAFNLKSQAPDVTLGWRWAETGLDMLLDVEEGPGVVADWVRKQCGQNSFAFQRYAGPAWEAEKPWRARLLGFAERRFGEPLSRFALGVRVLAGRAGFPDRMRQAALLRSLAYEELLRYGAAPHAAEAATALRDAGMAIAGDEELRAYMEERARCLEAAAAGEIPPALPERDAYPVAMALLGRGARDQDARLLGAAAAILERLAGDAFQEEKELIARWRAHVADPAATPRPPLPFDGVL